MSGIDNLKQAMGWLNPNARAACGNCAMVMAETINVDIRFKPDPRCSKGGFVTKRFAICDQYAPMLLTGGSVPK